ncbi:MAG: glycoside hydrolase family 3 N-terminal domain-containing protein, partial [bacterium]
MRIHKTSQVVSNHQVLINLWILAILVSSCYRQAPIQGSFENITQERSATDPSQAVVADSSQEQPTLDVEESDHSGHWAQTVLSEMTLGEKVAQMMMPWILGDFSPEGSDDHDRVMSMIDSFGIGGVIVSVGSPSEVAVKLNGLQNHSEYPLLVAADLETGAGFRFGGGVDGPTNIVLGGATMFPSLMAFGATGDPELAYELGRITGLEAKAIGVHVPFAPVLDVNNNPENPIINIRSFGEDPAEVARMGVSFVRGIQDNGSIATGKHFPGHGDTGIDSHNALPVFEHGKERLQEIELVPFQAAIDAGMRAIMTAHIAVPDLSQDRLPATLTEKVLTDLLRSQLGFEGIVFTDAMDMGAVTRTFPDGEASVRAVMAGADVILMPSDVGD